MTILSVVTLNTWCPPQGKHRAERVLAIADEVKHLNADVVCLQEMFMQPNRASMIAELSQTYPYHHYFASGILGSGLLTFSKFPILDAYLHTFRLAGKPEKIQHGDYYVAKGVGLTRLQTPSGILDVYNTHTHAQYEAHPTNEYAVFNHTNLYEIARFIHAFSGNTPLVICGDFNSQPHDLGYKLVTRFIQLNDVFSTLHPNHAGITYSVDNPYVVADNQRLDYIMVKNGVTPTKIDIAFTQRLTHPTALAYSDHYGLWAELSLDNDSHPMATSTLSPQTLISDLMAELVREKGLTKAQQLHHFEQTALALVGIVDSQFTGKWLIKRVPVLSSWLKRIGLPLMCLYAGYHAINAVFNLRARSIVLDEMIDEISHQQKSHTIFTGEQW